MTVDDGIFGNITVTNGSIGFLQVTNGPIGQVGTPVTISVGYTVESLQATEIHANIDANYVNRLVTTTGDLTGSINAIGVSVGDGVIIADDMTASLTLSGNIEAPIVIEGDATGDITANRLWFSGYGFRGTITIGDKLIGDLTINDANGVDEQVIFNANNNVYANWLDAWTGDVIVHGTAVLPKGKCDDTNLGGEAIGIARFTLHKEACVPVNNADLPGQPPNNRVELFHYGPVQPFDDACTPSLPMVKVERRNYDESGAWTNVTGSFDSEFDPNKPNTLIVKPTTATGEPAISTA